jgi:hypothetical protein
MGTWSARRITAALALGGGLLALVGNGLAPRFSGDDVRTYHSIANSGRWAAANVIILFALLFVTAAFAGIARVNSSAERGEAANYGRVAALVGGAIALANVGIELYAYRQQAKAFTDANSLNVVSAFWATNALDHLSAGMFATWTIVLLGVAPILLGIGQLRSGAMARLGYGAIVGGLVCVVVGVGSLLKQDQSTFDIPFAVGSVIVTIWLLATGLRLWREPAPTQIDLADQPTSSTSRSSGVTA